MPWLKSHSELRSHPKVIKVARLLGVGVPQAIGHLHLLWWWVMTYAPSGDLSDFVAEDLSSAAGWDGDPVEFVDALVSSGMGTRSGFLERDETGHISVHDWDQHGGRDVESRRASIERKRRWRQEETTRTAEIDGQPEQDATRPPRAADAPATRPPQVRGEERRREENPPYTPPGGGSAASDLALPAGKSAAKPKPKKPGQAPSPEFERFWASYPRKVAKDAAWQVWCRLLRGSYGPPPRDPEALIAAAARYGDECRADCREQDKILHARTFLGPQRRWTDYVRDGVAPPLHLLQEPIPTGDPTADLKAQMRARQEAERGVQCRQNC